MQYVDFKMRFFKNIFCAETKRVIMVNMNSLICIFWTEVIYWCKICNCRVKHFDPIFCKYD